MGTRPIPEMDTPEFSYVNETGKVLLTTVMDKATYVAKAELIEAPTLFGTKLGAKHVVLAIRRKWRSPYKLHVELVRQPEQAVTFEYFKRNRRDLQER